MLRVALEIVGIGLLASATVLALFGYVFAASVRELSKPLWLTVYILVILAGYALLFLVAQFVSSGLSRRLRWDLVLLAFPLALAVVAGSIHWEWPLRLTGWEGHGMGVSDGLPNIVWLPWVHAVFLGLAFRIARRPSTLSGRGKP